MLPKASRLKMRSVQTLRPRCGRHLVQLFELHCFRGRGVTLVLLLSCPHCVQASPAIAGLCTLWAGKSLRRCPHAAACSVRGRPVCHPTKRTVVLRSVRSR